MLTRHKHRRRGGGGGGDGDGDGWGGGKEAIRGSGGEKNFKENLSIRKFGTIKSLLNFQPPKGNEPSDLFIPCSNAKKEN